MSCGCCEGLNEITNIKCIEQCSACSRYDLSVALIMIFLSFLQVSACNGWEQSKGWEGRRQIKTGEDSVTIAS